MSVSTVFVLMLITTSLNGSEFALWLCCGHLLLVIISLTDSQTSNVLLWQRVTLLKRRLRKHNYYEYTLIKENHRKHTKRYERLPGKSTLILWNNVEYI